MPAPTEQEQLQLSVILQDDASKGIAKLRDDLAQLTGGSGRAQLDAFRRQQEATGKQMKEVVEASLGGGKAMSEFAFKLGTAGAIAGAAGLSIAAGFNVLQEYSSRLVDLGNKARAMGVSMPELKSIIEQGERVGLSAQVMEQAMAGFSYTLGELSKVDSPELRALLHMAGPFKEEMLAGIRAIKAASTEQDKVNEAQIQSRRIFDYVYAGDERNREKATKAENEYLKIFSLEQLKGLPKLDEISEARRKHDEEQLARAQATHEKFAKLYQEEKHWAEDIASSFLTADGLVNRGLDKMLETVKALRASGGIIVPGGGSILGHWLGRLSGHPDAGGGSHPDAGGGSIIGLRRFGHPDAAEPEGAMPRPLLGETPPPMQGGAGDGDFHAAAQRWTKIFGQSQNIEDRRALGVDLGDLGKDIQANTGEMKKLNDKLALLTRPDIELDGLGGLPGFAPGAGMGRGAGGGTGTGRGGGEGAGEGGGTGRGGGGEGGGEGGGTGKIGPGIAGSAEFANDVYKKALAMGIPEPQARLAAAQAQLESRGGKSGLASKYNNLFGIKGDGTAGSVSMPTSEQGAGGMYRTTGKFAAYSSPEDSIRHWWAKIQRQWPAAAKAKTLEEAARGLRTGQQGGYATDREYVGKILGIGGSIGGGQQATPSQQAPDATTPARAGTPGTAEAAADFAATMNGLKDHDPVGHALLVRYLRSGGEGMDPATSDWCAAFVNASMHKAGLSGPKGADVATNWAKWGTHVDPADVRKGDVVITMGWGRRRLHPGELKGHVALATGGLTEEGVPVIEGDVRVARGSGRAGHMATTGFAHLHNIEIRRPPERARADRAMVDKSTERDVHVETSGTLSANVNGPRGAKVTVEGGGLFNKTEMSRQTPMGAQ
jgi:hypothetical protein